MAVTGTHIAEDTLRRAFSWTGFQTLLSAGESNFDFSGMIVQNSIYYVSQGLSRFACIKLQTLKDFSAETQRIVVYTVTFFATAFLVPRVLSMMGRSVSWHHVARNAAASTAFWYFLNPGDEFTRIKRYIMLSRIGRSLKQLLW